MRPQLRCTTDYSIFRNSKDNRDLVLDRLRPEHRELRTSLAKHGFDPASPIKTKQNGAGLVVVDGQHRLSFAQEMGLPVYYVVSDVDIDVAELQGTQAPWRPIDFAKRWAADGRRDYIEALNFHHQFPEVSITWAFRLLAGTRTFANICIAFKRGTFKITQEDFAYRVASLFQSLRKQNKKLNHMYLHAVYACCYVGYFDERRLLHKVEVRPDKLVRAATRDQALEALEDLYNFGAGINNRVALKLDAEKALLDRSPVKQK